MVQNNGDMQMVVNLQIIQKINIKLLCDKCTEIIIYC